MILFRKMGLFSFVHMNLYVLCPLPIVPKIILRKEKTLLLFVIRDHIGSTPLANLSNTLKADLERIWQGLSKVGEVPLFICYMGASIVPQVIQPFFFWHCRNV